VSIWKGFHAPVLKKQAAGPLPRGQATHEGSQATFGPDTNLRSTDVERYTPKFLKNWETQLFQKYLGIRFASDTKDALLIIAEVPSSRSFSAVCIFHLYSAGVGSRRLI